MKYAKEVFAKSDKNHDGCLDEDEWEGPPTPPPPAGPAPAGPPPPHTGESRVEGGDQIKPGPLDTEEEFNLMDSNGDGKISRSEAYTYVSEYMDSADLNAVKLQKIFADADMDKDNYLSEEEFETAGSRHKGDG